MIFTLVFSWPARPRARFSKTKTATIRRRRIVRISYVEGDVRLDIGHGYESATMNVPLTERNWLQKGSDGWAEVQLEDGSLIRAGARYRDCIHAAGARIFRWNAHHGGYWTRAKPS